MQRTWQGESAPTIAWLQTGMHCYSTMTLPLGRRPQHSNFYGMFDHCRFLPQHQMGSATHLRHPWAPLVATEDMALVRMNLWPRHLRVVQNMLDQWDQLMCTMLDEHTVVQILDQWDQQCILPQCHPTTPSCLVCKVQRHTVCPTKVV